MIYYIGNTVEYTGKFIVKDTDIFHGVKWVYVESDHFKGSVREDVFFKHFKVMEQDRNEKL